MKNHKGRDLSRRLPARKPLFVPLIVLAIFETLVLLLLAGETWRIDWISLMLIAVNIVIWGLPIYLEVKRKQFDFFHPLVFTAIFFGLPMILIKGCYLAFGGQSLLLTLTDNPDLYLHLALAVMAIGWLAVLLGFYLPLGGSIIKRMRLPKWLKNERRLKLSPLIAVFLFGVLINILMIRQGAFGSSLSEITGDLTLVSVLRPFSATMSMAFFLLIFGTSRYNGTRGWRVATILAGIFMLGFTLVSGSRSALFSMMIMIGMAVNYAQYARVGLHKLITFISILIISLAVGVLVITQFRSMRLITYQDSPVSVRETISLMGNALQDTGELLFNEQVGFIGMNIIDRFVSIDTLGVTLARAESLKSAEKETGIYRNIVTEIAVGFIPRAIWPSKPLVGEFGLTYTRIYLESPYRSSNGPTMFGDLYRNFGYIGIPLGMFIVGLYLKVLYGCLIQSGIKGTLTPLFYVFLFTAFNWEATYTPFILNGMRTLFALIALVSLLYLLGGLRTRREPV